MVFFSKYPMTADRMHTQDIAPYRARHRFVISSNQRAFKIIAKETVAAAVAAVPARVSSVHFIIQTKSGDILYIFM